MSEAFRVAAANVVISQSLDLSHRRNQTVIAFYDLVRDAGVGFPESQGDKR